MDLDRAYRIVRDAESLLQEIATELHRARSVRLAQASGEASDDLGRVRRFLNDLRQRR